MLNKNRFNKSSYSNWGCPRTSTRDSCRGQYCSHSGFRLFLVGAGAIAGASGGLALGGISGGLASTLMSLGIKKDELVRYKQHLETGSFMVIVHGTDKEIHEAQHILHTEGTHFELDTH